MILEGERLRREIARRGLSLEAFGRAADVGESAMARAVNGRPVSHRTLVRIVRALRTIPALAGTDELVVSGPQRRHEQGVA